MANESIQKECYMKRFYPWAQVYLSFYCRHGYLLAKYHILLNLLAKKTVVQLKHNLHKLFYRSQMEIYEVHWQNFASYEQKIYQIVSPNVHVHCQNICATIYIYHQRTRRSYTWQKDPTPLQTQSSKNSCPFLNHSRFLLLTDSLTGLTLPEKNTTRTQHKQILICKWFNYKAMYM